MNFLTNTKYYLYILVACCLMACGDDKKNEPGNSPLTPDEHKAKLENIGKDFVAKINAEDHKEATESLYCLGNLMDDESFDTCLPEYLQSEDEENGLEEYPMDPYVLNKVIKNNDMNALMALATKSFDDEYKISDFNGIYIYTNGTWTKTSEATGKWELHYTDSEHNNVASVLTMTYAEPKTYTKVDNTLVEVPGTMTLTLTVGGKEVLEVKNNITLSTDMYNAEVNCTLTLADNYSWTLTAKAAPDKVSSTLKMTVKGEELINGSAEVTGTNLTDPDNIDDKGENILNNGTFAMNFMNVRLTGSGDIKAIVKGMDKIEGVDPWDRNYTEALNKEAARQKAQLYNDYLKIEGLYIQENQKFADIRMGLNYEEERVWINGKNEFRNDWYTEPVLIFTSDDSETSFESFFTESRFSSLINSLETLINKYTKMVGEDYVEL